MYWIESSIHFKVIKVATVEGKNIKTLIKFEVDRKPQNIVLDPHSGYVIHFILLVWKPYHLILIIN